MAKKKIVSTSNVEETGSLMDSTVEPAESTALADALANNIARQTELLELLQANQPKRKLSQLEVIKRQTHWREFTYPVYQNGYEASADGLSDASIKRAATLAPGRYLDDFVEVLRTGKGPGQKIHLFYKAQSIDDRIAQKSYFTSFSDLLVKVHNEMQARGIAPVE